MMQLLLPATIHGHTDDLAPNPGEPHRADEHRRYNENTCTSAKTKNPHTPVSRVQNNESGPGEATPQPQGSAIVPAKKNPVAATKRERINETVRRRNIQRVRMLESHTRENPIKAAEPREFSSVYGLTSYGKSTMHHIYRNYRSPTRRWLAGAPGGWWPSDVESAFLDEEYTEEVRVPRLQRRTPCNRIAPYGSVVPSREPQPTALRHGPQATEGELPMLPHGSIAPHAGEPLDTQQLERSFGSLSTIAFASDDDSEARTTRPMMTSSSSA
ncbi:hypothetical protein QAD02_021475 [Eretmocerus hayati]|uniref:Uncharacterized protein n=1 Tax=Eretmocerus hayati TaxID=131215 RepID=A0ACC2PQK1_9HYME|nr:hypothetical protein QAD02_021475 [Eretmocerus hayati]